ncbi:hypothetical protein MNBD_BACTEROID03-2608 [hydrothermal vent metagenome]|uniref:Uncharacterized protein n=1 Tax=hydrothermal vent metagenome TaxID=652676 RepID=A0A3B0SZS9_9ZZZZ
MQWHGMAVLAANILIEERNLRIEVVMVKNG